MVGPRIESSEMMERLELKHHEDRVYDRAYAVLKVTGCVKQIFAFSDRKEAFSEKRGRGAEC